jgi:methionyl-tRNA formyltransferase
MTNHSLRIVFMGTPDFAVESLKTLVENDNRIVGVITAPDKPAGRGQKLRPSPVKTYAISQNLPVLQPLKLKDPAFLEELKALKADLQIIVAFRMLPEVVWNMPRLGSFNLHASLLPQYRGAAPINWAVINGEEITGVTTFFLQHEIDTGNIILQKEVEISPSDNAGNVHDKLMLTGAQLVLETVHAIESGTVHPVPQPESEAELKAAPKLFKEDCRINWELPARQINNLVRGLSPYPAAWTEIKDRNGTRHSFKIFDTYILKNTSLPVGSIETDNKTFIHIGTSSEALSVNRLQLAGKKQMAVGDFLRGFDASGFTKAE